MRAFSGRDRCTSLREVLVARMFGGLCWLPLCLWLPFTLWLWVYAMPLSGSIAGLAALTLVPKWRRSAWRWALGGVIWLAGLLAVPVVGVSEYAKTTNSLHCRALGYFGEPPSSDCASADVAVGQQLAMEGKPLFSMRERLGVHGFNHLLALGGTIAGLPEVANETVLLSWTSPVDGDLKVVEKTSDFPMRSAKVRKQFARALQRARKRGPLAEGEVRTLEVGGVHWSTGGAGGSGYLSPLRQDSLRVALALEVPDSQMTGLLTRRNGKETVSAGWSGTIAYPASDQAFEMDWPLLTGGTARLRVSEALFAGMQKDRAMNPYFLRYSWAMSPDDPRLSGIERDKSERGWLETQVAR